MKLTPIVLSTLLLLGIFLLGCAEPVPPKPPKPPEVVAAVAIQHPVRDYSDFSGTLAASEVVEVRARVEGYLLDVKEYTSRFVENYEKKVAEYQKSVAEYQKAKAENRPLPLLPRPPRTPDGKPIKVQEDFEFRTEDGKGGAGTIVEKDSLLFVIDPEPFEVALEAAIAKKTQSQARLDLARANLARYEQLLQQEAVTVEEYQRNRASRDVALGQVAADEAAIREAELNLRYTIMRADFAGRVDRRYVDPGNLVGAQEKTLLTTIRKEDPMQVYFDVSEKMILDLLERKRANENNPQERYYFYLKLGNETDFVHEGWFDYLENRVDPETGTAIVRAEIPNKDGYLYDGLNVMIRVPGLPIPDAVLVHESAIGTDLGGKYVMVIEPGKDGREVARLSHVELGTLQGEMRVIRSGIQPGQKYVYEGLQFVRDGSEATVGETVDLSNLLSAPPDEQPQMEPTTPVPAAMEATTPTPSTVNN